MGNIEEGNGYKVIENSFFMAGGSDQIFDV